jgi:hypothetical protein
MLGSLVKSVTRKIYCRYWRGWEQPGYKSGISTDKDLSFIAGRNGNTNVGFINHLRRNKSFINGRGRSVNLRLDKA